MFPCCMSKTELNSRNRSILIDKELKRSKHIFLRTTKMLLLGSGESGKSTFLKQMRILHGEKYRDDEVKIFKHIIYANIVKGMRVLIDARVKLNIEWQDEQSEKHANYLNSFENNQRLDEYIFSSYVDAMSVLWKDAGIQEAFERRIEYQLSDSVKYFLNNIDRISEKDYVPSNADILHSRKATKGISEHEFMIRNVPFKFVDVGGQRSQRQKWYQCFECVTSILFLVSSSEFDQVLFEDRQTNRLRESADIFETIVNNRAFENVSIILFLNKSDLLEEKIRKSNIGDYFRDFKGNSRSLRDVQEYQVKMFNDRRMDDRRAQPLFHHFTNAVDTENIKYVFQAVKDTILRKNIRQLMLH